MNTTATQPHTPATVGQLATFTRNRAVTLLGHVASVDENGYVLAVDVPAVGVVTLDEEVTRRDVVTATPEQFVLLRAALHERPYGGVFYSRQRMIDFALAAFARATV